LINNRQQSGRRRGRGGQRQNNTGGGGRQDNGNRIDSRARGNAAQLLEKYKTLARDAQQGGDRVLTEYYLQFADHYFRVLSETRARYEENNPQARRQQNDYSEGEQGFEGDEGDEGDDFDEFARPQQRAPQPARQERPREDRPQRDGNREERPRRDTGEERQSRDDRPQREDRPREDRPREERPRREYSEPRATEARSSEPRAEQGYAPRDRADESGRPRRPLRANGGTPTNGRSRDDDGDARLDMSVLPPAIATTETPAETSDNADAPAPRKRGRPRKLVEAADSTAE
jgi:Domain of unknown function (DUF4167)